MIDDRLRRALGALEGVVTMHETWQNIMRRSGPDASIQLVFRAVSAAAQLGRTLRPVPPVPWAGPERLDALTRVAFFFHGLGTIGFAGALLRVLIMPGSLENRYRAGRRLARKGVWPRLTAIEPHGRAFSLAAAALGLLSGIGAYRADAENAYPFALFHAFPYILGLLFPDSPVYGVGRLPRTSPSWLRPVALAGALVGLRFSMPFLRAALMSQQEYEERRQKVERSMEGST